MAEKKATKAAAVSTGKKPAGISLSTEARELADKVKEKLGVSRTAVIEMAIRDIAEREGVR